MAMPSHRDSKLHIMVMPEHAGTKLIHVWRNGNRCFDSILWYLDEDYQKIKFQRARTRSGTIWPLEMLRRSTIHRLFEMYVLRRQLCLPQSLRG
nr:hypothetical protein [Tanacetum cinerariifolium]